MVKNKEIFPICFVDECDKPISPMICVSVEEIKWDKRNCNCTIYFLKYGNADREYENGTKFYVFYDEQRIGSGILGEKSDPCSVNKL